MCISKPGFAIIEGLIVALVTAGVGLFSVGSLQASENLEQYNQLSTQASTTWSFVREQCETLKLSNNCNRYMSARSYGGGSTSKTTLKLRLIPDKDLVVFSDANFRILGSQDSRGQDYELRTSISDEYDFIYTGGGGILTLNAKDFMAGKTSDLLVNLEQIDSDIKVDLWINNQKKLSRTVVGNLDHSDQYIAFGEWENQKKVEAFYGKIAVLGTLVE